MEDQGTSSGPVGSGRGYSAFISYRHVPRDQAAAVWLLRAIETYRVPRGLRSSLGIPARLVKAFRDEDELPSSEDLNDSILRALEQSRVLVAVCSPDLKNSRWCRKEIRLFREWDRPVLALIVAGDPSSSDPAVDAFTDELRTRMRRETGPDGAERVVAEPAEPIAADLRPRPGISARRIRQIARVKIVAGLLGVRFDDLWQRDRRRRRQRQLVWGTAVALLVTAASFGMRSVVESRANASRQGRARVAADLTAASLSGRDLDDETRAILAVHALRLHDSGNGGDLNSIDLALRLSLKELGPLCDTVEWSATMPAGAVVPLGGKEDGVSGPAAEEASRFLRGSGSAGGVMSVAFLPDDSALAIGLCSTPINRRQRPFALWAFPRCEEPALAGFAPRVPQTNPFDLSGLTGLLPTVVTVSPSGRIAALVSTEVLVRFREGDGLDESNWFRAEVLPGRTTDVAFDPTSDSRAFRLAYSGDAGTVRICSMIVSQEATYFDLAAAAPVRTIAYRPDGGGLAAGCDDGSIRIWSTLREGAAPDLILDAHDGIVSGVAFGPDGIRLASAGDDGIAAIWDLRRLATPVLRFRARGASNDRVARAVAFSSRGDLAIGWSAAGETGLVRSGESTEWARPDGAVYLYRGADIAEEGASPDPITLLPGNSGGIRSLAFNHDGSLLAAGCEDLSVHVWLAMPEDLVAFAKRFVRRELTEEEWRRFTQDRVALEPAW